MSYPSFHSAARLSSESPVELPGLTRPVSLLHPNRDVISCETTSGSLYCLSVTVQKRKPCLKKKKKITIANPLPSTRVLPACLSWPRPFDLHRCESFPPSSAGLVFSLSSPTAWALSTCLSTRLNSSPLLWLSTKKKPSSQSASLLSGNLYWLMHSSAVWLPDPFLFDWAADTLAAVLLLQPVSGRTDTQAAEVTVICSFILLPSITSALLIDKDGGLAACLSACLSARLSRGQPEVFYICIYFLPCQNISCFSWLHQSISQTQPAVMSCL